MRSHPIQLAYSALYTLETYSKRQKDDRSFSEDRGQKVDYCYVVVSATKSVLTFMATAISTINFTKIFKSYAEFRFFKLRSNLDQFSVKFDSNSSLQSSWMKRSKE